METSGPLRVIALDSDPMVLDLYGHFFERAGFHFTPSSTLPDLIHLLEEEEFDVCVFEHVPHRNWNLDSVARFLADGRFGACIMASNYVTDSGPAVLERIRDPRVFWLKKPFKFSLLVQTVRLLTGQTTEA